MNIKTIDLKPDERLAAITVDTNIHPREAVLGAAYVFTDRCYVWLDSPGPEQLRVELKGRTPLDEAALEVLAGEFGNELLSQTTRLLIAEHHRPLIESIVGRAVAGARGADVSPELDLSELEALELDDEPFEDPLGIAVSWEDKYGKNKRKTS